METSRNCQKRKFDELRKVWMNQATMLYRSVFIRIRLSNVELDIYVIAEYQRLDWNTKKMEDEKE